MSVPPTGTLWLVATPIGNLGDFPPRGSEILASVELMLAAVNVNLVAFDVYLGDASSAGQIMALFARRWAAKDRLCCPS